MALATFFIKVMKEERNESQHQPADPNLDTPSEANRTKHINFREAEEESGTETESNTDDVTAERRRQWKEGLEAGKQARNNED